MENSPKYAIWTAKNAAAPLQMVSSLYFNADDGIVAFHAAAQSADADAYVYCGAGERMVYAARKNGLDGVYRTPWVRFWKSSK